MAQYIDKSAVVAEIERWQRRLDILGQSHEAELCKNAAIQNGVYCGLLSFFDTLEVKEVDLDYIKNELDEVVRIYKPDGDFGWGTLYNIATHFFELGLQAQKDNIRHSMDETPNYPCDILFVTDVDTVFLYRYMENGRPVDRETPYFRNIQNGKCWYYCNDIMDLH